MHKPQISHSQFDSHQAGATVMTEQSDYLQVERLLVSSSKMYNPNCAAPPETNIGFQVTDASIARPKIESLHRKTNVGVKSNAIQRPTLIEASSLIQITRKATLATTRSIPQVVLGLTLTHNHPCYREGKPVDRHDKLPFLIDRHGHWRQPSSLQLRTSFPCPSLDHQRCLPSLPCPNRPPHTTHTLPPKPLTNPPPNIYNLV